MNRAIVEFFKYSWGGYINFYVLFVFFPTAYLIVFRYSILSMITFNHNLNQFPAAKSLQSCPTLCNLIDGSPPGSPGPGILQARTLEWVAISFSKAWKWKVKVKSHSHVRLFATPWTAAHHVPPSMGFSRQEYWSGMPSPSLIQRKLIRKDTWTPMFIAVLFTIDKTQKQPKCPSTDEWKKKI